VLQKKLLEIYFKNFILTIPTTWKLDLSKLADPGSQFLWYFTMTNYSSELSFKTVKEDGTIFMDATVRWPSLDYAGMVEVQGSLAKALHELTDYGRTCICNTSATPAE
jgi:hypothetical protein